MMLWDSSKYPSWEILSKQKCGTEPRDTDMKILNKCTSLYHCYMHLGFPCVFSIFFHFFKFFFFSFQCYNLAVLCSSTSALIQPPLKVLQLLCYIHKFNNFLMNVAYISTNHLYFLSHSFFLITFNVIN